VLIKQVLEGKGAKHRILPSVKLNITLQAYQTGENLVFLWHFFT
jgi:hypothetical protein